MRNQELLRHLIKFPSITPNDAGCQTFLAEYLTALGFECQHWDDPPVSNLFARIGNTGPFLVFAGHTDVVPAGTLDQWNTDPFVLSEQDGVLSGRGTADMKGSIAAMLDATARLIEEQVDFTGSLGFLITSGEEGDHFNHGTPHIMQQLAKLNLLPDYCIVGEPSSQCNVGDMIKIGRRGSLSAHVTLQGKQGHVAYPHLANNPIHLATPILDALVHIIWDQGNQYFPPTSLQITEIHAGAAASNIIPGELVLKFNIRYSTEHTAESLKDKIEALFSTYPHQYHILWHHNGIPFLTQTGKLLDTCRQVITQQTGHSPELSTSGGTSDGRFIAPYGVEVIELGLKNATIHQVNEHIHQHDLDQLTDLYYAMIKQLLITTKTA
jgi:succinyl-diaminopimelate desuccinylase